MIICFIIAKSSCFINSRNPKNQVVYDLVITNDFQLLKHQPHKMIKHTQIIHQLLATNCLNLFDHFVGLAPNGFK